MSTSSTEEIKVQNFVQRDEIDQAIAICEHVKPTSSRVLHLLGVLYAKHKGDHHVAIDYLQQALQMKEEVYIE